MAVSLRSLLIVPFVFQIVGITVLVGYLSYRSGQEAVSTLAYQLMEETGDRTLLFLSNTLSVPHQVNQINADAIANGYFPDLDTQNPIPLEHFFWQQIQRFPTSSSIALANEQGGMVGAGRSWDTRELVLFSTATLKAGQYYTYVPDAQGARTQRRLVAADYDVRKRPWYQVPARAGRATWSPIYQFVYHQEKPLLGISAGLPLYRQAGNSQAETLQGVLATDITLEQISIFLSVLEVSQSGQIFIMERSGELVATSTGESSFIQEARTQKLKRMSGLDSTNPLTRATIQTLLDQVGPLASLQQEQLSFVSQDQPDGGPGNRQRYFVNVMPYQDEFGLDWLVVVVVPQSDFMGVIQANVRQTVLFCSLALLGSIGFGIGTVGRLTRPLHQLDQAVQMYATGETPALPPPSGIRELDSLHRAFRQMMEELDDRKRQVETLHASYALTLEQAVAERTEALKRATDQLQKAQRIAQVGSWELDRATGQHTWSEQLFRILGLDRNHPEPTYPEVLTITHPEDRLKLRQAVAAALTHGLPYEVEHRIIRTDGAVCYLVSRGEAVYDHRGQVVKLTGTAADITERKEAELALQQVSQELTEWQERYEIATWAGRQIIFEYHLIEDRYIWGRNTQEILGYDLADMPQTLQESIDFIHPEDQPRFLQLLEQQADPSATFQLELRLRRQDGTYLWVEDQGVVQMDGNGQPIRIVGSLKDICDRKLIEDERKQAELELQQLNARLEKLATLDSLTQLANRRKMIEVLQQEWYRCRRTRHPISLILLDIDHFKAYNDYYGHPQGDDCLRQVAQVLQACVHRPSDLVARYGGEEFLLILPNTDLAGIYRIANRIQQKLQALAIPHPSSSVSDRVTASMGIAVVMRVTEVSLQDAIVIADKALYQAKQTRNTYQVKPLS